MRAYRYIFLLAGLLFTMNTGAQCLALPNFTYQLTSNSITCTNMSTGTVAATTYTWNFFLDPVNSATIPSGPAISVSNLTSPPTVSYTANGQYLIQLLASNHPTCTTYSYTTTIVICTFTSALTQTVAGGGSVVTYSTDAGGAGLSHLHWKFQDGVTSVVNPYTHIYFNGTFNDSLFLYFANELCVDTLTTSITVNNNPCVVDAAFTYTTLSGGMVNFAPVNPKPGLVYSWDFGDGAVSSLLNPGHTFASSGNYTVSFSSNLNPAFLNCADTIRTNVNVTGIPCIANSDFSLVKSSIQNTYLLIPANPYNFSATSWDWGDGKSSAATFTSHVYNSLGNYQICLTATAVCGTVSKTCLNAMLSKDDPNGPIYVNVMPPAPATSLQEWSTSTSLDLFPNPVRNGILYLRTGSGIVPDELEVYDLLGRFVGQPGFVLEGDVFRLDLTSFENGIYVLRMKLPKEETRTKIIVSK